MKKVLWVLLPLSFTIPTVAQEAAPALAADGQSYNCSL